MAVDVSIAGRILDFLGIVLCVDFGTPKGLLRLEGAARHVKAIAALCRRRSHSRYCYHHHRSRLRHRHLHHRHHPEL